MKILMFGRGVISALYGWALERAGHTVEFYVRPGRAAQYGSQLKLELLDARKKLLGVEHHETWSIRMREELPADHDYDLIIVSVQHYRFAEAAAFLAPRTSKATVLVFNNLFTEPQAEVSAFPAGQVVWGFPQAGGGFDEAGTLKGALMGGVFLGRFEGQSAPREDAVRTLFKSSGFSVREQADFKGWLWVHFATNAGLHAQVLKAGSFEKFFASSSDLKDAVLNVREMFALVEARGIDLSKYSAEVGIFRLPPAVSACAFKLAASYLRPVKVITQSHSNPEELRVTCRDALAEARRSNFHAPRLEALETNFAVS